MCEWSEERSGCGLVWFSEQGAGARGRPQTCVNPLLLSMSLRAVQRTEIDVLDGTRLWVLHSQFLFFPSSMPCLLRAVKSRPQGVKWAPSRRQRSPISSKHHDG